jgi:hypothetical protein
MVIFGIEKMETWSTSKREVLDMLETIEEYAHAT